MSFINFESSRVKDAERQALREAREKILTDAEAAYKKKQAQAQRAKERGDDQWMLPSVEAKLASSTESSKKKRKKEKKAKKSKKKKKKYRETSSDSDSSATESTEWVEKQSDPSADTRLEKLENLEPKKPLEREDWMSLPGSFLCSTRDEKQKNKDDNKKTRETCILDKPGQNARELNPYWRDGGTGLPEMEKSQCDKTKIMDVRWLKKSLRRAEEQAEEEGISLEEIAAERWGSLDTIKSMIEEAEKSSRRSDNRGEISRQDGRKFSYRATKNYDADGHHSRREENNRGKYRRDDNDRHGRSKHDEGDGRSRSRSRDGQQSSNRFKEKRFSDERKNMTFRKPEDHEHHSPMSSSRKSSANVKRWQKPEAKDECIAKEKNSQNFEKVKKRSDSSSSDQSDSEKDETKTLEVDDERSKDCEKVMTEAEMNQLGAKIVKAEIMGDTELAANLKSKLESARESRKNTPMISRSTKVPAEENVILTEMNAKGMIRPVQPRALHEEPTGGRRKGKKVDTHESGKRVRYFADDDKLTLQEMFQREKGQSSAENDATFVKMASKSMDMEELFEQRITREESDAKQDVRDRTRAIKEHKKLEKSLDNCHLCLDSKNMLKHLIVAMGSKTYVSLPSHVSATVGHCILAPIHHVSCQTQLDEDVWEELQNFKKALAKMFMDRKEFPVFFETFFGQHRFPHMQLQCIPLPDEVGSMAPIYFKKALLECETEWSTNKKVVDLSNKNVRQAIPKGLPYFAVNFGNHGGFAHVIEDEKMFPQNFAQEIIGGVMDLDHSLWRKPRRENFDQQRKKVLEFAASWQSYDFTTTKNA